MRTLLVLWLAPLAIFWSWYFLSLNDVSDLVFSRALHDHVFGIYGEMLGIDPAEIPPMIAKALVVDSVILGAIIAFRRRRRIAAWWRQRGAAEPVA
ncbi:hypothetical protein GTW51_18120 [Aurantimonas aggregata]|uniref:Uncharacterized protein n=1 Tax=Aurantimonas aggregata TaxID=2047720 RepID=A0A6L9MLK2_9HYPH|nr:DUF6105 family protein [Aurantimonas aggregata]NDV88621.1 hypothetical protein [Aurantimonas aggregata]